MAATIEVVTDTMIETDEMEVVVFLSTETSSEYNLVETQINGFISTMWLSR